MGSREGSCGFPPWHFSHNPALCNTVFSSSFKTQRGLATLGSDLRSGLGAIGAAVMAEATGIHADVREVKRDLASVRESVADCRAENMEFFASFTAGLEDAHHGIEIMRVGFTELC